MNAASLPNRSPTGANRMAAAHAENQPEEPSSFSVSDDGLDFVATLHLRWSADAERIRECKVRVYPHESDQTDEDGITPMQVELFDGIAAWVGVLSGKGITPGGYRGKVWEEGLCALRGLPTPALQGLPTPETAPSAPFRLQFGRDDALVVRWGAANQLRILMERQPDPKAVFRGITELLLQRQTAREETERALKEEVRSAEAEALKEAENYSKEDEGVQKRRKELCTKVHLLTNRKRIKLNEELRTREAADTVP